MRLGVRSLGALAFGIGSCTPRGRKWNSRIDPKNPCYNLHRGVWGCPGARYTFYACLEQSIPAADLARIWCVSPWQHRAQSFRARANDQPIAFYHFPSFVSLRQGNFRGTSGELQGNFRGASGELQRNFRGTSGELQGNFRGTSGKALIMRINGNNIGKLFGHNVRDFCRIFVQYVYSFLLYKKILLGEYSMLVGVLLYSSLDKGAKGALRLPFLDP